MKTDLDDLRGFVAVAELGSFHAAADALHLSQPALTRRIQKLEATLGVQLIDRDTRQLRLSSGRPRLLLQGQAACWTTSTPPCWASASSATGRPAR